MYRYRQTLLFIFILLVVTAAGLFFTQGGQQLLDPSGAQGQALFTTAGIFAALVGIILLGVVFSAVVNFIAGVLAEEKSAQSVKAPAAPSVAKKTDTPYVPLYDNRSVWIFGVVVTVGILGFLAVRSIANGAPPGYPLDRLPDWGGVLFSIPTSPETTFDVTAGMIAIAGLGVVLVGMIVSGVVLAFITGRLGKQTVVEEEKVKAAEAGVKKTAAPAPKPAAPRTAPGEPKPAAPAVPLSTDRSLTIFYLVVGVGIILFLIVRWVSSGNPIGDIPGLNATVFELPAAAEGGEPFAITALMLIVPAILAVIGGAIVAGFVLARGVEQATRLEKDFAKAPPAWPAPQLAALEPRVKEIVANPPRPRGWVDNLILVLGLATLLLIAVMVVPGVLQVSSADQAIAATATAAQWTPTPRPGPTATPLPLPQAVFDALPAGDAARGQELAVKNACAACHVEGADPTAPLAGSPWLAAKSTDGKGIAQHAAERWQAADYKGRATSAESYLVESILAPNDYVVSGYAPNIMPGTYGGVLSDQDLADIVAYLLTLQ